MGFPRKRARAAYEQCTGLVEAAELLATLGDEPAGHKAYKRQRVRTNDDEY